MFPDFKFSLHPEEGENMVLRNPDILPHQYTQKKRFNYHEKKVLEIIWNKSKLVHIYIYNIHQAQRTMSNRIFVRYKKHCHKPLPITN